MRDDAPRSQAVASWRRFEGWSRQRNRRPLDPHSGLLTGRPARPDSRLIPRSPYALNGGTDAHDNAYPRTYVGGLVLLFLIAAQQACQPDARDQTEAEGQRDAEHAEGTGDAEVWGYEGDTGPDRWGGLDPSFAVRDTGVEQSPVDLAGAIPADAAERGGLDIRWRPAEAEVVDNGHTIQVDVPAGSSITLEGRQFSLAQFHFHLPSEHTVDGGSFPMEVHFVHAAEEGDLAVIGVFMDAGEDDPTIQSIWEALPGGR